VKKGHEPAEGGAWFLRPFFRWFDRLFYRSRDIYLGAVQRVLRHTIQYLVVFALILVALGFLFHRMPTAYLPDEDQGMMMVQAILPPNATLEVTEGVMRRVRDHFLNNEKDAVQTIMFVVG
jgi:HAE1 family hydrophobic/amphiphilic exporter-1